MTAKKILQSCSIMPLFNGFALAVHVRESRLNNLKPDSTFRLLRLNEKTFA